MKNNVIYADFGSRVRPKSSSAFTEAYEHYLEGFRLDEDESTLDRAEAAYRRAIELDPSLTGAITNLGSLLYGQGRMAEAKEWFIRAIRIDPRKSRAYYNLGLLLYAEADFAGAELNFKQAIHNEPDFADAHFNVGIILCDLRRDAEACPYFETYLKLDPDSEWADKARYYLRRGYACLP